MRIGYCTNLIATGTDGTGQEWIESGAGCGFDYVELPLAQMAALDDAAFSVLAERVEASGLKCESCNNFFPPRIRLTGDAVDYGEVEAYLDAALERAARLGVKIIVFGSPKSKNVPDGFPMDRARSQLVELLRRVDPLVAAKGITVVIEPLCRLESNIINTAAEGLKLVRSAEREHVRLLIDYYHLVMEQEDPDIVLEAGAWIRHTHFANPDGRTYPARAEDGYLRFLDRLARIGYAGRMSVEAYTREFQMDGRRAVEMLRGLVDHGRDRSREGA